MANSKPVLEYMHIFGRGEMVRLTLALAGVEWSEVGAAADAAGGAPCPRYVDENVDLEGHVNAVTRHLGRKHSLYGDSLQEQAHIDQFVDAADDVRRKYLVVIYGWSMFGVALDAAKKVYFKDAVDPATARDAPNGSTDFQLLSKLLQRNKGGMGWAVGDRPSIADVLLFDIVDLHCRMFGEEIFEAAYPQLVAFMHRFSALPSISSYLENRPGGTAALTVPLPARSDSWAGSRAPSPVSDTAPSCC